MKHVILSLFFFFPILSNAGVQGTCTIDDDENVDSDVIGSLYGESSVDLFKECNWLADKKFGSSAFSKVSDVQDIKIGHVKGTCTVDDDENVDSDLIGEMFGFSSQEIRMACHQIAQGKFGDANFSAITNLTVSSQPLNGFSATCTIDDDENVDSTVIGTIYGMTSSQLYNECAWLAGKHIKTTPNYSALSSIQQLSSPLNGVNATCVIDDDENVDSDVVGKIFGNSTFELHQECQAAAEAKFGATHFFLLQNVSTSDHVATGFSATCTVDDDENIDSDVIGTLYGWSTQDLRAECAMIAKFKFKTSPFSTITNIVELTQPLGHVTGSCTVDDDENVDSDVIGTLYGTSTLDLTIECSNIATMKFGASAFFLTSNTQVRPEFISQVTGTCTIDDDENIDSDVIGTLSGPTTNSIREACHSQAQAKFGAQAFSKIDNIQVSF